VEEWDVSILNSDKTGLESGISLRDLCVSLRDLCISSGGRSIQGRKHINQGGKQAGGTGK